MTSLAIVCPICESTQASDYQHVGNAPKWEILRCRTHRLEFANALPPERKDTAKTTLDVFYGTDASTSSPRYIDFMDRVARVTSPPGVLHDVGCGNGQLMAEAQRRGWIVQGNDVVPEVVAGLARDGFTAHVGSLPEISAPVGSCDVITSFCVLPHHLVDPLPDMYAAQQMLSPGGWFILQLPDNGPYRKIAHWAYRLTRGRTGALLAQINQPNGHQFAFDRKNLTLLLEKCGFSVERIDDYFLPPHWSTVRFARRPWWIRIPATAAVHVVYGVSRALKQPNHMFVYARKPAVPQVASAESRP